MLNVAIVCGGYSGEYEVSLNSGGQVFQHLDKEKFIPFLVIVRKQGWICRLNGEDIPLDKNNFTLHHDGKMIRFRCCFQCYPWNSW